MKAIAAMILAALLSACSVNVIVAPGAALTIDSENAQDYSVQQKTHSENVGAQQ